jgi:hypothetical protein
MKNPARHISRFKVGPCLKCGRPLTGIGASVPAEPKPGDLMVCGYCSHIMEWAGDKVAELSDEARKAIEGDPDIEAALIFAAAFRQ